MIEALDSGDYEYYEKLFESRQRRFTQLLTIEGDLMEFSGFTWGDIQKLKVLERRFYVKRTNEMIKRKNQQNA